MEEFAARRERTVRRGWNVPQDACLAEAAQDAGHARAEVACVDAQVLPAPLRQSRAKFL